jgi:ribosomal protein L34E
MTTTTTNTTTAMYSVVTEIITNKKLRCDICGKTFAGSFCTTPYDMQTDQVLDEKGYRDIVCMNCLIELIVNAKKQRKKEVIINIRNVLAWSWRDSMC